jgi:stage IV sporulation protein FB
MLSLVFMFDRGFLTLGKLRGIPIRIHWTMPVGAAVFGGLRFAPAFWLGFFLLVLVHELGHAFYVRRYGHRVLSIEVTGFGGLCRWSGAATPYERAAIAWGGVVAQGLLLLVALAIVVALGPPRAIWSAELAHVFVRTNLWLIGLNLLPIRPLDGAEAWPLARHVFEQLRARGGPGRRPTPPRVEPREPPAARPPGPADPELRKLAEKFRSIGDQAGRARRP